MPITRFGAQDLVIGAISSKMVEPQPIGDKVMDLDFTALRVRSDDGLASSFNFLFPPSLLVFFSNRD
jgi:hypothetical protein